MHKNIDQYFVEDDGDFRVVVDEARQEIGRLRRAAIVFVDSLHPMEPGGDTSEFAIEVDKLTNAEVVGIVLGRPAYPVFD